MTAQTQPLPRTLPSALEIALDLGSPDRLRDFLVNEPGHGIFVVASSISARPGEAVSVWLLLPPPFIRLGVRGRVLRTRPQVPGIELQLFEVEAVRQRLAEVASAVACGPRWR